MGKISLNKEREAYIKKYILNFNSISVRESRLKLTLNKITNIKVEIVLDPVFLLSKNEWREQFNLKKNKKKYVLLYDFHGSKLAEEVAQKMAKKKKVKLIKITKNNFFNMYKDPAIENFLELFYNAEYIITTSFHGLAFAINFNKNFYTIKMDKSEDRIINLLELINLKHRNLKNNNF